MTMLPAPPAGGWPWEKVYPEGCLPDPAALPLFPVQSILEDGARDHPDRIALAFRGRSISYGDLNRMADETAAISSSAWKVSTSKCLCLANSCRMSLAGVMG